uniref:Uncharacterized protein n=1 Tax=Anguilla anguilla TaxID=7936 RepID=A0A0E9XZD3_ANGAN
MREISCTEIFSMIEFVLNASVGFSIV